MPPSEPVDTDYCPQLRNELRSLMRDDLRFDGRRTMIHEPEPYRYDFWIVQQVGFLLSGGYTQTIHRYIESRTETQLRNAIAVIHSDHKLNDAKTTLCNAYPNTDLMCQVPNLKSSLSLKLVVLFDTKTEASRVFKSVSFTTLRDIIWNCRSTALLHKGIQLVKGENNKDATHFVESRPVLMAKVFKLYLCATRANYDNQMCTRGLCQMLKGFSSESNTPYDAIHAVSMDQLKEMLEFLTEFNK